MSRTVFIFDIDSTIADNDARAALLHKQCVACLHTPVPQGHHKPCPSCGSTTSKVTQESWDSFLDPEVMAEDKPIEGAIRVLNHMRSLGFEVHFITGRNELHTGDVTKEWLEQYTGWRPEVEQLIMRQPEHHGLPASQYKEIAFQRLREICQFPEGTTFVFFEDDPHVFNLYQKYGLVVRCPEAWEHFLPKGAAGHEPAFTR